MTYKMLIIHVALILSGVSAFAESDDYTALCTDVIDALAGGQALTSSDFTNRFWKCFERQDAAVHSLAGIALSISLSSSYENTSDESALKTSYMLCTNIIAMSGLPQAAWQRSVARLLSANCLGLANEYGRAYSVCTNALADGLLSSPKAERDRALWSAIAAHEYAPGISITNAVNLCAALSLIVEGSTTGFETYTNGLPPQAMAKILKAIEN